MASITYEFDTSEFDKALDGLVNAADSSSVRLAMSQGGLMIETAIKQRAPVDTGNYRRSWSTQSMSVGSSFVVIVGTNAAYGPRLEFGFHGADRLGRVYSQAAQPHVEPALHATRQAVIDMLFHALIGSI